MKKTIFALFIALAVTACSKEKVSVDTLEQARAQARENATFNAQEFRMNSPQYQDYKIQPNGDSTQTNECPQGDGWATLKIVRGNQIVEIKCSTFSAAVGCMTKEDFTTKPYSSDDGRCQSTDKVPFPFKKIGGV